MGKRFEGEAPTFLDMITAFQVLGLATDLGEVGPATAFASQFPQGETVEFSVVPGMFTAKEIADLREWAS